MWSVIWWAIVLLMFACLERGYAFFKIARDQNEPEDIRKSHRGLAIGLVVIALALVPAALWVGDKRQPGGAVGSALESASDKKLQEFMNGDMCDSVENVRYTTVAVGTISYTDLTGDLNKPLPAIIRKADYICVLSAFQSKKPESAWVHLAVDEEFNMARCINPGAGEQSARETAASCKFKEAKAE